MAQATVRGPWKSPDLKRQAAPGRLAVLGLGPTSIIAFRTGHGAKELACNYLFDSRTQRSLFCQSSAASATSRAARLGVRGRQSS